MNSSPIWSAATQTPSRAGSERGEPAAPRGAGATAAGELRRNSRRRSADCSRTHVSPPRRIDRGGGRSLAYVRAQFLVRELRFEAAATARDPRRLDALHEWSGSQTGGVDDPGYRLFPCSRLDRRPGEGRAELRGSSRAGVRRFIGVFSQPRLASATTSAPSRRRRSTTGERAFVLSSPTPRSAKFTPNTARPVPKLAVVLARRRGAGSRRLSFLATIVRRRALCPASACRR